MYCAHHLRLEERLAGADPLLRVFLLALLGVGVPGAGIADRIDVGEVLAPAAEIVHHAAQRVEQLVEAAVVEGLFGVNLAVAKLLVDAGHADEQRRNLVLDLVRPDLLAVAGLAPLVDVILHLRLDFEIAAAQAAAAASESATSSV